MSSQLERRHAEFALRLLLDGAAEPDAIRALDWDVLLAIAQRNGVLIRLSERLAALDLRPPERFAAAVADERARIRTTVEHIGTISRVCSASGIDFVFPKAFAHYPDMGRDVDMLVRPRSAVVDALIIAGLRATAMTAGIRSRIAGTAGYVIEGCRSPLDIHHGRLGNLGEHDTCSALLLRNRQRIAIAGVECFVPSRPDQLVVQGLQGVYGRLALRLSDIVHTISSVRLGGLDWDYIISTATQAGVFPGLCCYLAYAEQVHRRLYESHLLPAEVRQRLLLAGWGQVEFRHGRYRFPALWVNSRLYLWKFGAALVAGNWDVAGRLCLLPVVASAAALHKLTRSHPPSVLQSPV